MFIIVVMVLLFSILIGNRIAEISNAFAWWLEKIDKYFLHHYNLTPGEAIENEERIHELIEYYQAFPNLFKLFFMFHVKTLRDAFNNKELFDKIVKLN